MWYQDVSDKKAVTKAIDEYRRLTRDIFLEKYGFARSRIYFVLYNGEYYDCKPILWAAYKHQFGTLPVSHASSGTNSTIRPKLESMGFRVVRRSGALSDAG